MNTAGTPQLSRAGEDVLRLAARAEGRIAVERTTGALRRLLKLRLIEAVADLSGEAVVLGPDGEPTVPSVFRLTPEGRAAATHVSPRRIRPTRQPQPRHAAAHPPSETPTTLSQARQLAQQMHASGDGLVLRAEVSEREDRISFVGGRYGTHSLCISVSSVERVLIHWRGYVETNGLTCPTSPRLPAAGDRVRFYSASAAAMGGRRTGEVLRVTRTRCLVGYRFKYQQGQGPLATTWQKLGDVQLVSPPRLPTAASVAEEGTGHAT